MTKPVELHPEAVAEARAARLWYAERDPIAAVQFMDSLDHAMALVIEAPGRWPPYLHGTRRLLLRRFPFAIVFRELTDRIRVVAVAHQHRRPGYWSAR